MLGHEMPALLAWSAEAGTVAESAGTSILLQLLLLALLVFSNGFFVAAEFALVKVRLSQIEQLARSGSWSAQLARGVLANLDAYLSACQLGITLASLGLGWAGEAVAVQLLQPVFSWLGYPGAARLVTIPLAFFLITFLHISLGEQVPKIMAIRSARATTLAVAPPLVGFYKLLWPFIWMLHASSNFILALLGVRVADTHEQLHSEEELRLILSESAAGGEVTRRERLMMENVLDLEDKVTRQVMVPRRDIVFLNARRSIAENLALMAESQYTRFPLCDGDLDRVVGMVHAKDVLTLLHAGKSITSFTDLKRKIPFFPETMQLDVLLREFQKNRTHVAMVVDEYGTVSGMVSFENVLEQVVGPIQDEFDRELPMIIRRSNARYLVDALCALDELVEQCHVVLPTDISSDTVGGLVVELLGHIPNPGDKIRLGRHELVVLDAEPTRVRRVEVQELAERDTSPAEGDGADESGGKSSAADGNPAP
jgi:CBS domain containing-hemolysin-like protein